MSGLNLGRCIHIFVSAGLFCNFGRPLAFRVLIIILVFRIFKKKHGQSRDESETNFSHASLQYTYQLRGFHLVDFRLASGFPVPFLPESKPIRPFLPKVYAC